MKRTLVLDSSSLVQLRALTEGAADALLEEARSRSWLLVLTGHHFVEMLRHENDAEAAKRLDFLRWLSLRPGVGWLAAGPRRESLGMIPHVTAVEVAGWARGVDPGDLRAHVLEILLRESPAPADEFSDLATLRPIFWARKDRAAEIASIIRATDGEISSETIGELRQLGARTLDEATRRIQDGGAALADELVSSGDRSIEQPAKVAQEFLASSTVDIHQFVQDGEAPIDGLIRAHGLDPSEVPDEMQFNELAWHAELLAKVRLAADHAGLSPQDVSAVSVEDIPTCRIQSLLRSARVRSGARAAGSDLADAYLASLGYYIDLITADKRTVELYGQVRRRWVGPELGHVVRLRQIADLRKLLDQVEGGAPTAGT